MVLLLAAGCDLPLQAPEPHDERRAPAEAVASCADVSAGAVAPFSIEGTSLGQGDDTDPEWCDDVVEGGDGEELGVEFAAPSDGTWVFSVVRSPSNPVISVRDGCDGPLLACVAPPRRYRPPQVSVDLVAGQTVVAFVGGGAPFVLDIYPVEPRELDCTDQLDQDLDGLVDCMDPDCEGVSACEPHCPDLVARGLPASVSGSTVGMPDEYRPICNDQADDVVDTSDVSIAFVAPSDGWYAVHVDAHGFDAVTALRDGCSGWELACGRQDLGVELSAGQVVVAEIEGSSNKWYAGGTGSYTAEFFAVTPSETSCADDLDNDLDGVVDCDDPDCGCR